MKHCCSVSECKLKHKDKNWSIEFFGGYWRFVNHHLKLATVGFSYKDKLIENSDIIRFDSSTLILMSERYRKIVDNQAINP